MLVKEYVVIFILEIEYALLLTEDILSRLYIRSPCSSNMKDNASFYLILLSLAAFASTVLCATRTNRTVERPLLIGSFNIQNLGQSKMSNNTVMDIVKKILLRYDLVFVQEIVTPDEKFMDTLMKDLNKLAAPSGIKYMMIMSERLGRGSAKEQYAYIYRNDKLRHLKSMSYPDPDDDFMRPPYIAVFATPTLRDMKSMMVIGIHTQPKHATNETSALASVYDYAAKTYKVKDAIIMGDMNAGCANVRISDWDHIELWRRTEFTWLITHDIDTTLSTNCCPYDRFVIAGDNMEEAVIWESISAYKYRDEFGLSTEMIPISMNDFRAYYSLVSLEYTISAMAARRLAMSKICKSQWISTSFVLHAAATKEAEQHVKPSLCLSLTDQRKTSIPPQIEKQKNTYGFEINAADSNVNLYSESSVSKEVLQNLQKLGGKYPEFVSKEIVDAILYKEAHGALQDSSSHNDLEHSLHSVNVYYDRNDQDTTVHYCLATTIN